MNIYGISRKNDMIGPKQQKTTEKRRDFWYLLNRLSQAQVLNN